MRAGRRTTLLLGLLGLAVLIPACSSASDPAAAPTTEAPAPTTTTAPPRPIEGFGDHETQVYGDPERWVCRPDIDDDACDVDLDVTAIAADGTLTEEPFEPATDPAVDCFYVYPTVSRDATALADWDLGDGEERFVTVNQAARLQGACRLFAPAYRQLTLAGLTGAATRDPASTVDPYADVVDAFRTYLAEDNEGRGFVLVGHSQGSVWLTRLLREVIEPDDGLRRHLVGAYLAGTQVRVPEGEPVGGTFDRIPLCTEEGEAGCITTWSSWAADGGPSSAEPARDGVLACVHPGTVAGTGDELDAHFGAATGGALGPGADGEGGGAWVEGGDDIETPFVRTPGLASGTCTSGTGADHLAVTLDADPSDPRADDLPAFTSRGADLHLLDVNLAMGTVVASVEAQAAAYTDGGGS